MSNATALACFILLLIAVAHAKPTDLQPVENDKEVITYNPFSPSFKWTMYKIAAVTTAGIVITVGLAMLTTLFFPMVIYRICYALGGCQDTMDQYVDEFLGVEGQTKRIKRRDVKEVDNMDYIMGLVKTAIEEYSNQPVEIAEKANSDVVQDNIMKISPAAPDRQLKKRSPIDYIEPILVMASKAYNEFVDPELKKNFKKPSSIR